jgi:hypothetical protein
MCPYILPKPITSVFLQVDSSLCRTQIPKPLFPFPITKEEKISARKNKTPVSEPEIWWDKALTALFHVVILVLESAH